MHFAATGRAVVLLRAAEPGDAIDAESEFGSSEYAKEILGSLWGYPPQLDIQREAALQRALIRIIEQGLVDSAHDCSDGGLAVALAEKALPHGVGARVTLSSNELAAEFVLFGEDAGRIIVSCDPAKVTRIQEIAGGHGVAVEVIGETIPESLEVVLDGQVALSADVAELVAIYEGALQSALQAETTLQL